MSFEFDLTAPFLPEFSTKDQSEHRHKIRPVQVVQPALEILDFLQFSTVRRLQMASCVHVDLKVLARRMEESSKVIIKLF
ncbi:unnamed protein product [Nippostrongylus brasiliensis]|uniref:F-box domain-containing protein n=1 Tax=Nippostrongylus brasiliensis TaxID=27835 RepID=A0A0N4XFJ1_NIPBR|nr:unnamed protein product [Nippostrongylus brasiliensis]